MTKSTISFKSLISLMKVFALLVIASAINITASAQTNVVITASGTWTVPIGVTTVTVGCYGGGGGGGGAYTGACSSASGGGGGAFSTQTLAVSPGQTYTVSIGAGGTAGSITGVNGGAGGTTTFTGTGGTCSADGGQGGTSSKSGDFGDTKAGVSGGTTGIGFLYVGGNSGTSYHGSWSGSSGGGGGAGNGGAGGNSPGGNSAAGGIGGAGTYPGGAGAAGWCCSINNKAGVAGTAPGGGGSGGTTGSCSSDPGHIGGVGARGQVLLTYIVNPVCVSCSKWLNQNCATSATGSYINGGLVVPTPLLQNASTNATTGNYGYVFWSFVATEGTTYYFDLCYSAGTSGTSWLRLHKYRDTLNVNNNCMDANSDSTLVLQNRDNGCIGTGNGLSKLIWTCQTSGIYYLESAVNAYPVFWGVAGNQTATLSYKTLPSFSKTCGEVFYDKGSDGTNGSAANYGNNEDWIYTYYPLDTVADAINVQFISFNTGPGDLLCVYNGNSINAPLIGCYAGPSITGAFSSTANDGSLTFRFTSGDSAISAGWEANVSCVASLAVRENAAANAIVLFPNPAKNEVSIQSSGMEISQIEIYNAVGERVYAKATVQAEQFTTTLDISAFPSGVYFVNAGSEKGKWNGKFVKQ